MSLLRYLAYGSNLHPGRLQRRIPSARSMGSVLLNGWGLHFHKRSIDGSAKCNIVNGTHAAVHGAVFEMASTEKEPLDEIEGLGQGYEIIRLELDGFGEVFSYQAHPDYIDDNIQPYTWYQKLVLAGARFHRMPATYIHRIESFTAKHDPDPARTAKNLHILNQLDTMP